MIAMRPFLTSGLSENTSETMMSPDLHLNRPVLAMRTISLHSRRA